MVAVTSCPQAKFKAKNVANKFTNSARTIIKDAFDRVISSPFQSIACLAQITHRLLLHNSVLKTRGELRSKLFGHRQRQRLRHNDGSDSFPWFRYRSDRYRKESVGGLSFVDSDQNHSAAAGATIIREIDSQLGRPPKRRNDGDMRFIDVKERSVPEPTSRVSSGTMAGHLANAQRTHDCAPVCWTSPNDFDVLRSATKSFQLPAKTKDLIESSGVSCACPLGIFPPCPPHHMGSQHDARSCGIGIGLGRIAIFRARQNRKPDLS